MADTAAETGPPGGTDAPVFRSEKSVVIERSVEEVFGFTDNPANEALWQSGTIESRYTSEGPVGVGSTGASVAKALGRTIETTWEITEYEPNRRVVFLSTSGPIPYEGAWLYEAVDGGTRLTVTEVAPQGTRGFFGRLSERLLLRMWNRGFEGDLQNLKRLMEA